MELFTCIFIFDGVLRFVSLYGKAGKSQIVNLVM